MAFMKGSNYIMVFLSILSGIHCLYEDQAGQFDWLKQNVGKIKFADFEDGSSGRRIIVASEQNAIAVFNVRNGKMLWRKVLEENEAGTITSFIQVRSGLVTVSGNQHVVRAWNTVNGNLLWQYSSPEVSSSCAVTQLNEEQTAVGLLRNGVMTSLRVKDGKQMWSEPLPDSSTVSYRWLVTSADYQTAWAVGVSGSDLVSVRMRLTDDGVEVGVATRLLLVTDGPTDNCVWTDDAALVCIDAVSAQLWWVSLSQPAQYTEPLQTLGFDTSASVHSVKLSNSFVLRSGCHSTVMSLNNDQLQTKLDLSQSCAVAAVMSDSRSLVVSLSAQHKAWSVSLYDVETKELLTDSKPQQYSIPHHAQLPDLVIASVTTRKDGSVAVRCFTSAPDHSVYMLGSQGQVLWSREEGLASIVNLQMLDPPLSDAQASMEDEFDSKSDDLVSQLILRLSTQISQLSSFTADILRRLQLKASASTGARHYDDEEADWQPDPGLVRDEFNMRKVIVAASRAGKLFGLDSTDGSLLWAERVSGLAPFRLGLYIQRSTAHFPHPAHCVLLGRDVFSGQTVMYAFNPVTGQPARGQTPGAPTALGYTAAQTMLLHQVDEQHMKPILILDTSGVVHVYPPSASRTVLNKLPNKSLYMYTANPRDGSLTGYSMSCGSEKLVAEPTWTISISNSQTISSTVNRIDSEHVHSQGRVQADRSVLYKYVNPNMALICTEGSEKGNPFIGAYIIDTVTGQVLFHTTQKRATGPVHALVSENWILLSYWNTRSRRTEMTVLEMYEGVNQSNGTHFSSLQPIVQQPLIERQTYILSTRMSAMAVTQTEAGITSKQIVVALNIGSILSLAKALLDPRRSLQPTQAHREEGVLPYIPELPVNNELMPSYNQTVERVRGLYTTGAGLESTSIIFAYGLDLFLTRVTPSLPFDVLASDFDYLLIGAVLLGMSLASLVTQKLANNKQLHAAWK